MQQLSGLDASFIYLETMRTPMHIGGVYLLDSATASSDFSYDYFYEFIQSRLKLSRIFRQRLIEVPMGMGHPYWINDPDFNLDFHLPRMAAPRPGGETELNQLASRQFSRPLNRERPLWEMAFVDGIDQHPAVAPGSFAVIAKIHHAAIDGGSGAELMGALLDITPVPREIPGPDSWRSESVPSAGELIARSYGQAGRKIIDFGRFAIEMGKGVGHALKTRRKHELSPPTMPFTAPDSRFNQPVSSKRVFASAQFSLEDIKHIRKASPGSTVNDVILTLCGGALRRYLTEKDELPHKSLVCMAPISVRSEDQRGKMGNQVSSMLVKLETMVGDPLERLRRIKRHTQEAKAYSGAIPAHKIMEFVPSETAALAARMYTRMKLAERHRPFFNLVITNVPGPQAPLYMAGAQVTQHVGTAPILDGLGLILVVFSYNNAISIGITSCHEILPDPDHFADLLLESCAQLKQEADTVLSPPKDAATDQVTAKSTIQKLRESAQKASPEQQPSAPGKEKKAGGALGGLHAILDGLEDSLDQLDDNP